MVASYVHHIAAWMDGTESLPDGEYRVYHVVCELIYLNNGPIILHESGIAGRCNQHLLAFRRHLAKLVEHQKLVVGSDGKLSNRRAESELKARIKPQSNPPQTPARPPPDPTPTTAHPPPRDAAKTLISGKSPSGTNLASPSFFLSSPESKSLHEESRSQKERKNTTELMEGRRTSKGELLSPDWMPKAKHYEQGEKHGISRERVDAYADKMRNWATANAHRPVAKKSNWDAAFSNWLADKSERNSGTSQPEAPLTFSEIARGVHR